MTPLLQQTIRYGTYPFCVFGSAALGIALLGAGLPPGAVVVVNGTLFALLCFGLEYALPETPCWRWSPLELRTDALHAVLTNTLPSALFRLLFYGLIVSAAARVESVLGTALWPGAWPLAAQLVLALLVAELASYAIHRFWHESRLWPLHAVHHSSRRYYFLLATRKHPIQAFLTYGGRLTLLWLIGVPADVLALYTGVTAANSYAQHANLRLENGWLGWVFATPRLHRWHHSARVEESNANYGDVLIVWDVLFGTRIDPADPERLHRGLGLPQGTRVDHSYLGHLALPFVWKSVQPGARTAREDPTLRRSA